MPSFFDQRTIQLIAEIEALCDLREYSSLSACGGLAGWREWYRYAATGEW